MTALSLTPPTLDLTVYVGDITTAFLIDLVAYGAPLDLVGAIPQAQARNLDTDPNVAFTIGASVVGPVPGRILVTFNQVGGMRDALGGLSQWVGVWDLEVKLIDGSTHTILRGSIRVLNDVTRTP